LNISSSAPSDSYGIDTRFRTDVTIKDVLVTGFGVGIRAGNTVDSEIKNAWSFWNSLDGIYSESDSGLYIGVNGNKWTHTHSNLRNGVTISQGSGNGECSGTGSFVLEGISIRDNAGNGLEMSGGDQKICAGPTGTKQLGIKNNGDSGIYLTNSQNNLFPRLQIQNNLNYGFFADSSSTIDSIGNADIYDNGNDISTPFNVTCASGPDGVPTSTGGGYTCVTQVDVTPPVLTVPSSQTYVTNNATEIGMGGVNYDYGSVTATDNWSGSFVLGSVFPPHQGGFSCSQQSGSFFSVGTTTVTCTAEDNWGNVGTASFTVTIEYIQTDTTPPVLFGAQQNQPVDVTYFATNSSGYNASYHYSDTFYAVDDVDGTIAATCSHPNGALFPIGATTQYPTSHSFGDATTVTCTATDAAGNVGTTSFTITVLLPQDWVTVNASASLNSTSTTGRTLTLTLGETPGACCFGNRISEISFWQNSITKDGSVVFDEDFKLINELPQWQLHYQIPIPTDWEAGTYDISWKSTCCHATDMISGSTTVTVPALSASDTTPPVISAPIADAPYYGGTLDGRWMNSTASPTGMTIHLDVVAYDDVDGLNPWNTGYVPPVCSPPTGSNFPIGVTTVTCTATDAAGNVGTVSFDVTVTLEGAAADAAAAEEIVIPSWIKNNAGWWANGQIDDRSFVSGLQWLISNGIMNIPPTEQGAGSDDVIPGWIKNNAGWWADNLIDDRNFVTGLQWLITNGIMIIELE
jgi:hypothetical protein